MAPDLGMWSQRLPRLLLTVLVVAPLAGLVIAELAAALPIPCSVADPCRETPGGWSYWLGAPMVFLAFALLVVMWPAPHVGVWAAVVTGVGNGVAGTATYSSWWIGFAALWLGLALLDRAGRRRQRRLVAEWAGPVRPPPVTVRRLRPTQDTRWPTALVCGLLVVVAVVLLAVHDRELAEVVEFERTSQRVSAVVTDAGVDRPMQVDVGGRSYEIDDIIDDYPVGSRVDVLIDPTSGRAALVAEPLDPSWLVGCTALALLIGVVVAVLGSVRGQRRFQLLMVGGPTYDCRLLENWVLADGAEPAHEFLVGDLLPLDEVGTVEDGLHLAPRDTEARDPAESEDDDPLDTESIPVRDVVVQGHLVDGYPVLILVENRVYISSHSIRDPWAPGRLLERLGDRIWPDRPEEPTMSERDEQPAVRRAGRAISSWSTRVRSRALPIAYGSALLVLPLLWWFFDDPRSWVWADLPGLLGLVLAPAVGLHSLASWGRADLYPHPLGLRAEGAVLSTVIPEPRVEEILESTHSIVLQLRDPPDLLVFGIEVIHGLDDETSVPQAAATVESWLGRAVSGASTALTTRPSPRLGPAAVLVIGVLGWIAVRLS